MAKVPPSRHSLELATLPSHVEAAHFAVLDSLRLAGSALTIDVLHLARGASAVPFAVNAMVSPGPPSVPTMIWPPPVAASCSPADANVGTRSAVLSAAAPSAAAVVVGVNLKAASRGISQVTPTRRRPNER